MTNRRFENLGEAIQAVRNRNLTGLYTQITLDLSLSRSNQVLEMSGSKIFVLDTSNDSASFQVRFNEIRNDAIAFKRGREVEVPFYRFYLTNSAQPGVTATIEVVNDLDVMSFNDRFQNSDVTSRSTRDLGYVRSFWLNELENGRAFAFGAEHASISGNMPFIQLLNPAGSGKTIKVHKIEASSINSIAMMLRSYNPALGTLEGNGINLQMGGVAAVGEVRSSHGTAQLGTMIARQRVIANSSYNLGPLGLAVLDSGEGILVATSGTLDTLLVNFFWSEL